jgi:deoxyribodipyrimidine photo-lyase
MSETRPEVSIHWFRRDLRIADNHGLFRALSEQGDVLPLFIFDREILGRLESRSDRRVDFIHRALADIRETLEAQGGALLIEQGSPKEVWSSLVERYKITAVTANHDHEPYALQRDEAVRALLLKEGIPFHTYKDISIFERGEVMKEVGDPYTVFTPYSRKWKALFTPEKAEPFPSENELRRIWKTTPLPFPTLSSIGFEPTDLQVPPAEVADEVLMHYAQTRNLPGMAGTSRMSVHLRFGTASIRAVVRKAMDHGETYLNELIWREFFMQLMWHFPRVVNESFKPAYDHIAWTNDPAFFHAWCEGRTGFPFVDAGMRELRATGLMHNRARMVTASFLTKHLLADPSLGEAWFAKHLLDFELSSNNGNWQWASGSGCDASPWFRVFNPTLQQQRFDPDLRYVKRWIPEYGTARYPEPIVDHATARNKAIETYKAGLSEGRVAVNVHH